MQTYAPGFFAIQQERIERSPAGIIPIVLEQVRRVGSVIDVGCGTGDWLAAFKSFGAERVLGIDGDYVDHSRLRISEKEFIAANLEQPLPVLGPFDLAVCLEVGEHLPVRCASGLIGELCRLSETVLFSAALPGQGGTHHVNEQWPQYWQRLFRANGFEMLDSIRPRIWENDEIAPWYRQNIFLCQRGPQGADVRTRLHHEMIGQPTIRQSVEFLKRAVMRRMKGS